MSHRSFVVLALLMTACSSSDPVANESDVAARDVGGGGGSGGAPLAPDTTSAVTSSSSSSSSSGDPAVDPCGDGSCAGGESCATCPSDCGACGGPSCGDGGCDVSETCATCPDDCGACATCGDAQCNAAEDCGSCPDDCGVCGPQCGDASCDAAEDCESCPADCGSCVFDPCQNANLGDGYYCGTVIGGAFDTLYWCSGSWTSFMVGCSNECAECAPGFHDVCPAFAGQSDAAACGGEVCDYDVAGTCGGDSSLWCWQGDCIGCSPGFANCDGNKGCECDGFCVAGKCCDGTCTPGCPCP